MLIWLIILVYAVIAVSIALYFARNYIRYGDCLGKEPALTEMENSASVANSVVATTAG